MRRIVYDSVYAYVDITGDDFVSSKKSIKNPSKRTKKDYHLEVYDIIY